MSIYPSTFRIGHLYVYRYTFKLPKLHINYYCHCIHNYYLFDHDKWYNNIQPKQVHKIKEKLKVHSILLLLHLNASSKRTSHILQIEKKDVAKIELIGIQRSFIIKRGSNVEISFVMDYFPSRPSNYKSLWKGEFQSMLPHVKIVSNVIAFDTLPVQILLNSENVRWQIPKTSDDVTFQTDGPRYDFCTGIL